MLNQFKNLSCYEEFEIRATLTGISKIDVLKEIGHRIDDYYFFVSDDGAFNWFDLNGNHVEDPGILKTLNEEYIPFSVSNCIIPDSVTYIDYRAFYECELLTSITIPDSVTIISDKAFFNCKVLNEINIPDSVTSIGRHVFSHCKSLTTITIPDSVTIIGYGAFYDCILLTTITIPDSVTIIGGMAFYYCDSLKEVIFKGKTLEEVKQMKNYPFGIEDERIIKCELC